MIDSLDTVDLLGYLDCDPRPTFILDTTTSQAVSSRDVISPVYCNTALVSAEHGRLVDAIKGGNNSMDFSRWATNAHYDAPKAWRREHFVYHGFSWTRTLIKGRWNVISGMTNEVESRMSPGTSKTINQQPIARPSVSQSSFDWTGDLPPIKITSHIEFTRSIDWSQTSLGPMAEWSSQLRSTANLVMLDPRPAVIFWGPDLVMVYNEPYVEILGGLHPACMGACARIVLRDVWDHFEPIIERNLAGESVEETNTAIDLVRSGFLEETYFSLKFIPVWDYDGVTVGHYETVTETTREQKQQRRLSTLLELSEEIPRVRTIEAYWALATEVLSHNDKDVPFALLYSVECDDEPAGGTRLAATQQAGNTRQCKLRGALRVNEDSNARPTSLRFQENDGFMEYFRKAMLSQQPTTVRLDERTAKEGPMSGLQKRGFGDPCRDAAICPINPTSSDHDVLGFLVVGLNPRSPYDDDYRQFILMVSRLLSASLTSILWYEANIGQRERAMAQAENMKSQLMEQLLTTQKEVERNSLKFQRFAERADIGIFIIGMDGVYSYRNDAWYGIFQPKDREVELGDAWEELIDDEYRPIGQAKFGLLMEEKRHQSFELRLKRMWNAPIWGGESSAHEQHPMWVLCSVFPELSENGEVLEIVGCVTDIR
jgi:PAS domain-containing protein